MKPTLAKAYSDQNPTGMHMSEKLDGVRAIWTGSEFVSRNGKVFPAPLEIIKSMPKGIILDGELFGGRGNFQKSVGKVRKGEWSGLEYVVFDVVASGDYNARLARLASVELPAFVRVLDQSICNDAKHLDAFEAAILKAGGEGVMLRDPKAEYEHKRTSALLKVKRFKSDEAVITGYQDGQGKHAGRVGAFIVKMGKVTFKVGTGFSDAMRETPPAIGSIITFSFFELTDGGKPRFPSFLCVRNYE